MTISPSIELFNGLWNIFNCALTSFVLYHIWKAVAAKKNTPKDRGGYYLAISLAFWIASGVLDVIHEFVKTSGGNAWMTAFHLLSSWLSTWNSVFILCAIHHFDVLPEKASFVKHDDFKKWMRTAGVIISTMSLLVAIAVFGNAKGISQENAFYKEIFWPDAFFSFSASIFFFLIVRHSLRKEGAFRRANIGFILVAIICLAQWMHWRPGDLIADKEWQEYLTTLLLSTYKVQLLILFSLIMLSWAIRPVAVSAIDNDSLSSKKLKSPDDELPNEADNFFAAEKDPESLEKIELPIRVPQFMINPNSSTERKMTIEEIRQKFQITDSEIKILKMLALGIEREEIAEKVFPVKNKSKGTTKPKARRGLVDEHLRILTAKFRLEKNKETTLVLYALKNGIIQLEEI